MEPGDYEYPVLKGGCKMKKKEEKRNLFWESRFLKQLIKKDKTTREYVDTMYIRGNKEEELCAIWKKRICLSGILLLMCGLAWLYCFTAELENPVLSEGRYVVRQPEDKTVDFHVTGQAEKGEWEKKISVNVKQRQFSEKEKKKLEELVSDYVEKRLPGKNESLQKTAGALNFVTEVPGTEAELKWTWDEQYIKASGMPIASAIPKEGVDTEVMLEAVCRNWKKVFRYAVHLVPRVLSEEELSIQEVKKAMRDVLKEHSSEAVVELPGEVGNAKVTYETEKDGKSYLPVYIFIAVILLMPVLWREEQKKKMEEREEQMLLEHPGIVNKVMLLLSAGLTVRKTVERLVSEYEEERKKGGDMRYAYEEMCVMLQEMKDGVSEGKAIEQFGKRCRLLPYLRFSSVITQNLKKGAEGIIDILEKEAMEALEQRRARVLQMGETAGTKLLFPMLVMLGLVMGIIMIPAFMTM